MLGVKGCGGVESSSMMYVSPGWLLMATFAPDVVVEASDPSPSSNSTLASSMANVAVPDVFALNSTENNFPLLPKNPPGVIPEKETTPSAALGDSIQRGTIEFPFDTRRGSTVFAS